MPYVLCMAWTVLFHTEFEFEELPNEVQDELLARLQVLAEIGPSLGRPNVDTLNGSSFSNMKELRFNQSDGVWRFAFAFDPKQNAIVLVGGDKRGANQSKFYKRLIKIADERYGAYLKVLAGQDRKTIG